MGKLLAYLIVSGLLLLSMYLVYKLFIAPDNQHGFNRGLLLLIYLVSFCAYPLYNFFNNLTDKPIKIITDDIPEVVSLSNGATEPSVGGTVLIWIFLVGASAVTIKTIVTWVRIVRIVHTGHRLKKEDFTLVLINNDQIAPFSWMRYVVINQKDFNPDSAITTHELKHIRAWHWLDLIIAQVVCIVNWFNPAAWLLRDELRLVHEYQADMAVLDSGYNPQDYQKLLIKKAVGSRFPSLANSINHSKLKKRITMMYKSKSSAGSKLKALALVPMVALALGVVTVPTVKATVSTISNWDVSVHKGSENLPDEKSVIDNVEEVKAGNQVGNTNELLEFYPDLWSELLNNLKFPKSLEKENIDARTLVQFTINTEGYITDTKILKSSGYDLFDDEALRALNSINKKWTPRKSNGKAISVTYTMPFTFKTKSK